MTGNRGEERWSQGVPFFLLKASKSVNLKRHIYCVLTLFTTNCLVFSYIHFSRISAQAVRRGLKPDAKAEALKRDTSGIKMTMWKDGAQVKGKSHLYILKHAMYMARVFCRELSVLVERHLNGPFSLYYIATFNFLM